MKREFIVFDTETNGTSNCSVLSVAFIKLQYDFELNKLEKISDYYRFYYREPQESPNYGALKVNGLYDEVIKEKRISADYPLYFKDDIEDLKKFIGNSKHFIAHNISFDRSFIPFKLKYQFCTMNENVDIVKISNLDPDGYTWNFHSWIDIVNEEQELNYKIVLTPHGMLEPWIIKRHYWTRKIPALLLYQKNAIIKAITLPTIMKWRNQNEKNKKNHEHYSCRTHGAFSACRVGRWCFGSNIVRFRGVL